MGKSSRGEESVSSSRQQMGACLGKQHMSVRMHPNCRLLKHPTESEPGRGSDFTDL